MNRPVDGDRGVYHLVESGSLGPPPGISWVPLRIGWISPSLFFFVEGTNLKGREASLGFVFSFIFPGGGGGGGSLLMVWRHFHTAGCSKAHAA